MLSSSGMFRLMSVSACKTLECLYQVCHLTDNICWGGVTIDRVIKWHISSLEERGSDTGLTEFRSSAR